MKIRIDTTLDEKLQDVLDKKFCEKCTIEKTAGCCVGCKTLIEVYFLKEPTKFKKEEE